jgi:transposase-like protein
MESKSVNRSRRKYDGEFKKEVIRMIEMGRSVPEVSQSLGIGTNLVYQWIKRAKVKQSSPMSPSDIAFDEQKTAMQKRIRNWRWSVIF